MKKPTAHRRQGRIRAAVTALFGGDGVSVSDVQGMSAVLGADNGTVISPRTMLQISAVWACVRLIAETIATLPLSIYERGSDGGKRLASQHPLYSVLHDVPNPDATAAVFWESMVSAMLLRGAGRAEKLIFNGRLVGLVFLNPDRLTPHKRQGSVVLEWAYTDDNGTRRIIPAARVWTIPGFSLDGKNGVSVVQYGAAVFGQAIAADKAAGRVFKNGALQNIYYTFKEFLKKDQRDDFRTNVLGLLDKGQTPLLEGGIDVKALTINPKEVQLLESRGWSVEEIAAGSAHRRGWSVTPRNPPAGAAASSSR